MSESPRPRRRRHSDRSHQSRNSSSRRPTNKYLSGSSRYTAEQAASEGYQTRVNFRTTYRIGGYQATNPDAMEQLPPEDNSERLPPEDLMIYEQDGQLEPKALEVLVPHPAGATNPTTPQRMQNIEHARYATESGGSVKDSFTQTTGYESNDGHVRQSSHLSRQTGETLRPRGDRTHKSSAAEKPSSGSLFGYTLRSGPSEQEKQLVHENEELRRENAGLHQKHKETLDRVRELEDFANARSTMISQQKSEISSLKQQLGHLTQEQQGMEDQIRTAQLAMSKKSSRPKVGLVDDERTIKGNFLNLHDEIRKWSKDWGSVNFSIIESLSNEESERFLEQLAKVVALEDGRIPHALSTEEMSIRSSVLCVSAMLGRYICAEVLEAQFRPLRPLVAQEQGLDQQTEVDQEKPKIQSVALGEIVLRNMYQKLSALNESRAQVWRSDMMSILDPASLDGASKAMLRAQEDAAKRRTQAACELTSTFLNECVGVLLPQVESEDAVRRDEQLQSILQKALDMAGRLWKQLTIVKCVYLEDLNHESFSYESELMGPHAFHKLGLDDEDENRLDNHPIRIVVFPAVKGYGNSDGENYSQDRVWGKAIVWLDD